MSTTLNPNDTVRVKPTDTGWKQIHAYAIRQSIQMRRPRQDAYKDMPQADADGYIQGQYWWLMRYFDWSQTWGSESPFYDMIIESGTGTGDKKIVQLTLCNGGVEVAGETCDSIVEDGNWYNVYVHGGLAARYRASQVTCVDRSLV